jgi:hypothetical protein
MLEYNILRNKRIQQLSVYLSYSIRNTTTAATTTAAAAAATTTTT